MSMQKPLSTIFDQADAAAARERRDEIEHKKQVQKSEREAKKIQQQKRKNAELRAKFVAPVLLIITIIVSLIIWMAE